MDQGMNKALKFSKKIWPSLHRTPPPSDSRPSGVSEQKDRAGEHGGDEAPEAAHKQKLSPPSAVLAQHKPISIIDNTAVFVCDGDQKLNMSKVNDDYCDCVDGTDEPETSACVNGRFKCKRRYHGMQEDMYIFSSRVKDGVCDCCDGSDEIGSYVKCQDTCADKLRQALPHFDKRGIHM
mmetsp:Transcript_7346/g.25219  ORF Transcript_7346/g.25219 Transcript_7346/m.25219 type:complete len:179 (-) Transcript_7346:23-559(-)